MAHAKSNLDEVLAKMDEFTDSFQMNKPHPTVPGGTLGKAALDLVSQRIQIRCKAEKGPGGWAWAPNKDWKQAHAVGAVKDDTGTVVGTKPIGVLGDHDNMLSPENIDGEREVLEQTASMEYGAAGDEYSRRKAQWFTNGSKTGPQGGERSGAKNQPPRPFYKLAQDDKWALWRFFGDMFDAIMRTLGKGI